MTPHEKIAQLLASIVDGVRDMDALTDSACQWLDALPRGHDERERMAVERVTRLVARSARDARYLAIRVDEVVAAIVDLLAPAPAAPDPKGEA